MSQLVDTFGRPHNNLRISVTDRCNLRCTYCMPEEVTFLDKGELLSFEEIAHFVRVAAPLGIDKLRLTGGEPLMRRDLHRLVAMLAAIPGIRDIGATTNAVLLADQARALRDAGLQRLNISLDTLDRARFEQLARRDAFIPTLEGIDAAAAAGFDEIKLNAISIRGVTDLDAVPLARYARERGLEMRFIEYMPIGAESWERSRVFYAHEIFELLEQEIGPLLPAPDYDPRAPAMEFIYADGGGRVGIIASVSKPFCNHCNRLRLTAEGKLRNCLFALNEVDLKPHLRPEPNDAAITELLRKNVLDKWPGHQFNAANFEKPERTMHQIGG